MSEICTARLLDKLTNISIENGVKLDAILAALVSQGELLNDQAVTLSEACFKTDSAEPEILVPIITIVDGEVKSTNYVYPDGSPYSGSKPSIADPCDCPCISCSDKKITACVLVDGFDLDSGLIQAGEFSEFKLFVDGVQSGPAIVTDYTTTSNGTDKSTWYTPVISAINAITGWSATISQDVLLPANEKVTYKLEYSGTTASELKIYKAPVGTPLASSDSMTISVASDGTVSTSSDEYGTGNAFGSNPFSNCDAVPPVGLSWKTILLPLGSQAFGEHEFIGDNSGNPSNGTAGANYAAFEANLIASGYTITTPLSNTNGVLVVDDPSSLGMPSSAKFATAPVGDAVQLTWMAV